MADMTYFGLKIVLDQYTREIKQLRSENLNWEIVLTTKGSKPGYKWSHQIVAKNVPWNKYKLILIDSETNKIKYHSREVESCRINAFGPVDCGIFLGSLTPFEE